jgi:hypothetical protein
MNMEKLTKEFKIDYALEWTYGITIERIKEDISILESMGATDITIDPYTSYDCPGVDIYATATREETDDEYNARVEDHKRRKAIKEEEEKATLKRLKEKYNQ